MKILIGIPSMDMVSVHFCRSLVTLQKLENCSVSFVIDSLIYSARNEICRQALKDNYDYVLWLDSDMVFPPETIAKLLADGKNIVTGLYYRRQPPYSPVIYSKLEISGNICEQEGYASPPEALFPVAGCGFGCLLLNTDILRRMEAENGPTWFAPMGNVGEDLAFCIRARRLGETIWCDPGIKLGHVGHIIITADDYKREALNGSATRNA